MSGLTLIIYHELAVTLSHHFAPEVTNKPKLIERKEGGKERRKEESIGFQEKYFYLQCLAYIRCSINISGDNEQVSSQRVVPQAT